MRLTKKPCCIRRGVLVNFHLTFEASVAQLVERHLAKVVVEGSTPFARSICYGGVAQLVEQVTLNHWVHGSSPCTPTICEGRLNASRFFCRKIFRTQSQ